MTDNTVESEPLIINASDYTTEDDVRVTSSPTEIRTYKSRFWILLVFSFMGCFQCVAWNTWGPISQSVIAAFPGWNSSTVAMMGNWGTITFVLFIFPMVYLTNTKGLRTGVLTCAFLIAVGTSLRCITLQTPAFTILCHICAIMVGIPGTIVMAAPPLIASMWFPPNERTTATACCQALNQLGSVLSYLQPLIVRSPEPDVPLESIRRDIQRLMFIAAGVSIALLVCILIWFPSRPPLPPSLTSTTQRFEFGSALETMFRKKKFLLILVSYSVFLGFPAAWMSVLNFSFLAFGIHQHEAMFIGVLAISCSCTAALVVGRFTDRFYGYVKISLTILILLSLLSFVWFLLLTITVITPTKWQIYTSVIIGVSANFAASPLFFELSVETAYPAPEAVVGGVITGGNNLIGILFLLLFFIPSEGYTWVTYCLVGGSAFSLVPLLLVKEEYFRSSIDRRIIDTSRVASSRSPLRTSPSRTSPSSSVSAEGSPVSWFTNSNSAAEKLHHI